MSIEPPGGGDPIGYGKPPKAHRFKPGQSGNPKGRPKDKKATTLIGALRHHVGEPITVSIGGKRRTMSRADLIMTQLVNKAASGNLKAIETVMRLEKAAPESSQIPGLLGAADRLTQKFKLILEREKELGADDQGAPGATRDGSEGGASDEVATPKEGIRGGIVRPDDHASPAVADNAATASNTPECDAPRAEGGRQEERHE